MSMAPWAFQSRPEPGTFTALGIGNFNHWESESVSSLFHRRLLSILRHLYSSGVFDYCDQEALSTSDFTPKQWEVRFFIVFIESVECLELHQIRRFDSIFGQHLTILRQDAVIDHAVTLIGFGQEQKLAVATGEQMIWQELNRWHRRIDKWQAWACECKPFGPCRSFDKLDKLQSQLNVLLCLPSHLSCWGGSRRNSGLSKTPGANIGERQARDTWHRALIELCSSLCICGTGGHVVIPRVSDFTDFLWFPEHQIVNHWFPWLDDIRGHSQLQGGRIRLLREDDEKRCGWDRQAQKGSLASAKVCVTLVMISYDHGFFMWNFSVHFAHLRTRNSL